MCKAISDMVENARVKEREDAEKKIADVEKKMADVEKKREEAEKRAEKTEKILEVALKALREKGETDSDISKLVASVSAGV